MKQPKRERNRLRWFRATPHRCGMFDVMRWIPTYVRGYFWLIRSLIDANLCCTHHLFLSVLCFAVGTSFRFLQSAILKKHLANISVYIYNWEDDSCKPTYDGTWLADDHVHFFCLFSFLKLIIIIIIIIIITGTFIQDNLSVLLKRTVMKRVL